MFSTKVVAWPHWLRVTIVFPLAHIDQNIKLVLWQVILCSYRYCLLRVLIMQLQVIFVSFIDIFGLLPVTSTNLNSQNTNWSALFTAFGSSIRSSIHYYIWLRLNINYLIRSDNIIFKNEFFININTVHNHCNYNTIS